MLEVVIWPAGTARPPASVRPSMYLAVALAHASRAETTLEAWWQTTETRTEARS